MNPQPPAHLSLSAAYACLDNAPLAIFRIDDAGKIIEANQSACSSLGYTCSEITQLTILDIDIQLTPAIWVKHRQDLRESGSNRVKTTHRRKDGSTFPVEVTINRYRLDGQEYTCSFARDISEENRTQEKIIQSEFFLRKSQTVAHIGSYYMDTRIGLWISSSELDEIFGLDPAYPKDVKGWAQIVHPADREMMIDHFQQHVLEEHQRFDKEYRIVRPKDGQVRWVHGLGELEFDSDGSVTKMIGTIQDITQRRQVEEEIRLNEGQLRLLTDNMADVIGRTNAQNLLIYATPSLERALGYPVAELLGKRVTDWFHPDDGPVVRQSLADARRAHQSTILFEYRLRHANGSYVWMEAATRLLYDEQGQSAGAIFSLRDISERKHTEQLLQTLNSAALAMQKAQSPDQIFSAVAEALNKVGVSSAFFETDAVKQRLIPRYVSYNMQLIKILEKLTGLNFGKFAIPIERVDGYRQTIWERKTIFITSLEELTRQVLPGPVSLLAGQVMQQLGIANAILAPLIVEDEVIGQFTVQSKELRPSDIPSITAFSNQMAAAWRQSQLYQQAQQEIFARKQAEEQVRLLNDELEKRVSQRTAQLQESIHELEAFSYSVSHDLRAPLRAIDGFTSILAEDYDAVLDAEGKRICGVIRGQTLRMGNLIDDLLTFSRLNRAEIQPSRINMEALVRGAFTEITTEAERSRIQFKFGKLPTAQGDSKLIQQVWINLLSNAVKFSSKSEHPIIRVQATRGDGETIYSVRDNGAGFDMEYSTKLFGVFQRLHSEKEFPGTGVGLAIVQRIIHRHGGRVWAEGKVGLGATFYFSLPVKR